MLERTSQVAQLAEDPIAAGLPDVTLLVRQGSGREATYVIPHVDFLIGTVPGCDLRVPGTDLPAVLCLLARQPDGLSFRKLSPTQIILVNGQTANHADLRDGDRLTLGAMDIYVRLSFGSTESAEGQGKKAQRIQTPISGRTDLEFQAKARQFQDQVSRFQAEREAFQKERKLLSQQLEDDRRQLQEREKKLKEQGEDLDRERIFWLQRRQEIEQELADKRAELSAMGSSNADNQRTNQPFLALYPSSGQLDERKQRSGETPRRLEEVQERTLRELSEKKADLDVRERALAVERQELDGKLKEYQKDVLRLDRLQGTLEEKDRQLQVRVKEIDESHAQIQEASKDLERQVIEVEELRTRLLETEERLTRQKTEVDAQASQLVQRAASLEGQQTTLATLRTRLERRREEMRSQEQLLEEQRARQEKTEADLEQQLQEALNLRSQLDGEHKLCEQERQDLAQRNTILETAVQQLRQAKEKLSQEEAEISQRALELEHRLAALADQEGTLQSRLAQLGEAQERLDAERQVLRERTQQLTQAEQARETLQEQLRRRSEDLALRQKTLQEQVQKFETDREELQARQEEFDRHQQVTRQQLEELTIQLQNQRTELLGREEAHRRRLEQLKEFGKNVATQRKHLAQEKENLLVDQEESRKDKEQSQQELIILRHEAEEYLHQFTDLDGQSKVSLDRLVQAREQLREHLNEVHVYVRQCQEELEKARSQLQHDVESLLDKEKLLHQSQDEHRLAQVGFRQQLIEWQGQVAEMKRILAEGASKLERRQAKVEEQARKIDATTQQLALQTQELQEEKRVVADRRQEMDRHLDDMRLWYRGKLRELAGLDLEDAGKKKSASETGTMDPAISAQISASGSGEGDDPPLIPIRRDILSLTDPVDPGDRQLGELLRKMELVDADTLKALLVEARRQRRSLRQVLLADGVITAYQLSTIETGDVDRLALGPVRIIDRLKVTPQETVYHVFDPRRNQECLLRHLGEDEMQDPVRPDEFRQRYAQAMVNDAHLAQTLEILEIAGRPAVLQEWLCGLPSSDWPPLVAVPGVCMKLLTQVAQGLASAHQTGLIHGHLHESMIMLTTEGMAKICGLGDPPWLAGMDHHQENPTVAGDLHDLGKLVSVWCANSSVRRGAKSKPMPEALVAILDRLAKGGNGGFAQAAELLDELERVRSEVPSNNEAWDRLLRHVRENSTPEATVRLSA